MNLNILLTLLIVATLAATYVFWVRPLLKATPSLGYLYQDEERFWRAVQMKFSGLKQKIASAVIAAIAFVVTAYDQIAPMVAASGVDVTKLTSYVPQEAWPLIGLAMVLLLDQFRKIADRNAAANAAKLVAIGETLAAPAPVVVPTVPKSAPIVIDVPTTTGGAPVVPPIAFAPPDRGNVANS